MELNTIVQLTERLRDAEQRMAAEQQQLRQAETEAVRKVHDVRIRTEDKYRVSPWLMYSESEIEHTCLSRCTFVSAIVTNDFQILRMLTHLKINLSSLFA